MRFPGMLGLLLAAMQLLVGCASDDLLVKRQTETEARVEHLLQNLEGLEARLNELTERIARSEEKSAAREAEFQALDESVRTTLQDVNQLLQAKRQSELSASLPRVELLNPDPFVKGRESGLPPAYLKAFGLYSANNFRAAITAFEQFIQELPASDYVPNAHYWIGECYYSSSDLPQALTAFNTVLEKWPRHPKAADALLKIGYSHGALKQPEKARAAFELLLKKYPGSTAATKARERLMAIDFQVQ